jgi:PHD/YefM family antitoxin component YafN of YafNO toxin-antitoxin module
MIGELPRVERLDAETVRDGWLPALARVAAGEARLLIERDGQPVAALISAGDFKVFLRDDKERRKFQAALEATRKAFDGISEEEIEREVEKAIKEVRAERRERMSRHERLQEAFARAFGDVADAALEAEIEKAVAEVRAERRARENRPAQSA